MRTKDEITTDYRNTLLRAERLWVELLECVNAKPDEPEEPKYRDVREKDVGKEIEVSDFDDFKEVNSGILGMISNRGVIFCKDGGSWPYALIRITPEKPQQFKVGDWVVCREQHDHAEFTNDMLDFVGKAMQIEKVDTDDLPYFAGEYWYKAEWLSHATPAEIAAAQK